MKQLLKVHADVITVPVTMKELMQEYESNGYKTEEITMICFKLIFPDGCVHIFWEDGCIYQEIIE